MQGGADRAARWSSPLRPRVEGSYDLDMAVFFLLFSIFPSIFFGLGGGGPALPILDQQREELCVPRRMRVYFCLFFLALTL